jgi:hypothetical protein
MSVRTCFDSQNSRLARPPNGRRNRAADRQVHARRLFLEALEDRSLLAFNVLAEYPTGANPQDLALSQIDAGNQLDLVVVNIGNSSVGVQLGNPDGTFGSVQNTTTGRLPFSVATGDFTSDGIADVVSANANELSLLVGNGHPSRIRSLSILLPLPLATSTRTGTSTWSWPATPT